MPNITIWIEQGWLNLLIESIIYSHTSQTAEYHTIPCFRTSVNSLSHSRVNQHDCPYYDCMMLIYTAVREISDETTYDYN